MGTQKPEIFRFLPKSLLLWGARLEERLSRDLVRLKVKPNALTGMSLLAGIAAGGLFALERPLWAWLALVACGSFDSLDGKVAALTNTQSAFGAILDSTFDRYAEFFIYAGLAFHFRSGWALWLAFLAFLGSVMVSYTRARAEGLGYVCNVGIMQRAERLILLGTAALLGSVFKIFDIAVITALGLIAVFSNVTAIQRTLWVKKRERLKSSPIEGTGHE